jgi:hypothetical protein
VDKNKKAKNLRPHDAFEIFSYATYKKEHDSINPLTLTEKIKHKIKHHRVTKSEYDQIFEELKNFDPNEPIIWMGKPSQAIHLFAYSVCFLFSWLIFPLLIALYLYEQTKRIVYVITDQRLRVYSGIFVKRINDIELYRVKDTIFIQPLTLRLFGLSNIQLITSDASWGNSVIAGITNGRMLREKIRHIVETVREKKGVREIDYYTRGEPMPQGS